MSLHSLDPTIPRATAVPQSTARVVCRRIVDMELEDLKSAALWKAVAAEFLGCFFLVYFGVGSGLSSSTEPAASIVEVTLAAGFSIAAILTAFAAVSGAHVNPAVSIGFLVARQCSFVRFFFYVLAQSVGAIAGAALLKAVTPASKIGHLGLLLPPEGVTSVQALMAEFMITFFLVFCIIAMVDKGRTDVSGSIPFIVGIIVSMNIFYAHNISGASMNPIRNLGPAVILWEMEQQWIYWAGPMVGGALGALIYDRVFSVSMTPSNLRRSCLSRGSYGNVNTEEEEEGSARMMEVKPLTIKPRSLTGSAEKIESV